MSTVSLGSRHKSIIDDYAEPAPLNFFNMYLVYVGVYVPDKCGHMCGSQRTTFVESVSLLLP